MGQGAAETQGAGLKLVGRVGFEPTTNPERFRGCSTPSRRARSNFGFSLTLYGQPWVLLRFKLAFEGAGFGQRSELDGCEQVEFCTEAFGGVGVAALVFRQPSGQVGGGTDVVATG